MFNRFFYKIQNNIECCIRDICDLQLRNSIQMTVTEPMWCQACVEQLEEKKMKNKNKY